MREREERNMHILVWLRAAVVCCGVVVLPPPVKGFYHSLLQHERTLTRLSPLAYLSHKEVLGASGAAPVKCESPPPLPPLLKTLGGSAALRAPIAMRAGTNEGRGVYKMV